MVSMANILYLVHRMPYPPNKGDKVRSYHLLRHLAARHRVFLGTFVDDPDDVQHIDTVKTWCEDLHASRLNPRMAKLASLSGLVTGQALTLRYYDDDSLHRWVARTVASEQIDAVVVFSSSMAQYAQRHPELPMLLDLVDVDSAKWAEYAGLHSWPLSWVYRREGACLLALERAAVAVAKQSFLVTGKEVALFNELAPELSGRVQPLGNGVDTDYFAPAPLLPSPYPAEDLPLVFTGAMDYWPNIDAVTWFAQDALPLLRRRWPALRLHIVGRSPTAAVTALACDAVAVSGTVPDVRPYLQHAAVVVAPLRLARGVQNKLLEAMAMARPVVAASNCADAIDANPGEHLQSAQSVDDYVRHIDGLLRSPHTALAMGESARERVASRYSWAAQLAALDPYLAKSEPSSPLPRYRAALTEIV